MANHVVDFHAIAVLFKDDDRQLKRGENAYRSGHVVSMTFQGDIQPHLIKGQVLASQRGVKYSVEVSYKVGTGVEEIKCTCARGLLVCHHMAALLLHAHYNISATDVTCRWSAPATSRSSSASDAQPLENLYPHRVSDYASTEHQLSAEAIQQFRQNLGKTNIVGFSWLLKPEVEHRLSLVLPPIEELLWSEDYLGAQDKIQFFTEKTRLSVEQILEVNKLTLGQHENENWLVTRKLRLTASKFGMVLASCKRNKYPPSLFKTLFEGYSLHRVLAVEWGKNNEETALEKFKAVSGLQVEASGLWLHANGFLGASPDGLIGDNATLEIKCPYKYRNTSMKEGVQDGKYFFSYNEEDQAVIKLNHPYYHQIQGQLFITERDVCYFFVWTPEEYEVLLVEKDPAWHPNLAVLENFYLHKFLPAILDMDLD